MHYQRRLLRLVKRLKVQTTAANRGRLSSEYRQLYRHLTEDPTAILTLAGMTPDWWQAELLRGTHPRALLLCSRQVGKSQVTAAKALRTALTRDRAEILLISRTNDQSGELLRKISVLHSALGSPLDGGGSRHEKRFENGSRILALPGAEASIRCYSAVHFLAIDEAARVADELYYAVRPMLATAGGELWALSSAYAKLGWFYQAWTSNENWHRIRVRATECSRLSPSFLAEERLSLGKRWFDMEYMTEWGELTDAVFSEADLEAAVGPAMAPLFG